MTTVNPAPSFVSATSSATLDPLKEQILRTAALPLKQAMTLPADAYRDPAFYQWEVENVFKAEWMCLAHVSQVPEPGDYLNVDFLGEPLTVVRGKDRQVRVLSRVCPHRGMDILPKEYGRPQQGNTRLFICPYHTWTFELDGRVKGCPEMQHAEDFCKSDYGLGEVRSELFEGFVFVNLSGDAPPVNEQYADLKAFIGKWNLADMKLVIEDKWDCPFNWKVLLENWSESYHHMGAHAKTLQPMMPAKGTWTEPEHPHFMRAHLPYKNSIKEQILAAASDDPLDGFNPVPGIPPEDVTDWHLFSAYPCFAFVLLRDRCIWYRFIPTGPTSMELLTTTLCTPDNLDRPDWESLRDKERQMAIDFHTEDMEMLIAMQRGIESDHYRPGRLSHLEEPIWLIQRYLAARIQGTHPQKSDLTGMQIDGTREGKQA